MVVMFLVMVQQGDDNSMVFLVSSSIGHRRNI